MWTGGVGVRQLVGNLKVSGSIPGVGNFIAWKCSYFRDNSRLGKGIIPENSGLGTRTLTHFQIFRVRVGEFLGKLRSGNKYTIQIFKNPCRTPGYSKKFIQPTEGNCIPGQEKFDHWHPGWGPEQPVHFCISVTNISAKLVHNSFFSFLYIRIIRTLKVWTDHSNWEARVGSFVP